jgi:hypothetical protein
MAVKQDIASTKSTSKTQSEKHASAAPFETGTVRALDGVELAYACFGDQSPTAAICVLVPGKGMTRHVFDPLIDALAPYYRIVTYDLRGHGDSGLGNDAVTYDRLKDDLFSVFNSLQLGQAVVVGYADGGAVALKLAIEHHERVAALVLVSTAINEPGISTDGKLKLDAVIHSLEESGDRAALVMRELGSPDIDVASLSRVLCDTLIITGDGDMVKRSHTQLLADSIPTTDLRFTNEHKRDIIDTDQPELVEMIRHWLVDEG